MEIVEKVCEKSKPGVLYNYFKQAISHLRLDSFFYHFARTEVKGYSWSVLIHLEALDHVTAHMDQLLS